MEEHSKKELIEYRMKRAKETMREVELMADSGFWNAAVNRLYYACYYSVSAILMQKGINAQTHSGVRQMFGLHLVQPGTISRELGKFYSNLYDKRQTGDYDDFISFDKEAIDELLPMGNELIETIANLINDTKRN